MKRTTEHTGLISSYQLLITAVQTQAARWKAAAPEQLTGDHLYLDIAKSGEPFHGYSGGMRIKGLDLLIESTLIVERCASLKSK